MRTVSVAFLLAACTEHGMTPPGGDDDVPDDPPVPMIGCTNGHQDKIKFPQASSCGNDGSVEFCIPDGESAIQATLSAISPTIRCAPGGGRANCNRSPGLLLCFYPTSFPGECASDHGEMTAETWSDMCEIAGLPEVLEIVSTFFE